MSWLAWLGLGALVFAAAAAYEWTIAQYVAAEREARPTAMANWSTATTAIGLLSLFGILAVSLWFAMPELAGVWCGSYAAGRRRAAERRPPPLPRTVAPPKGDSVDAVFAPRSVARDPRRYPEVDRRIGFRGDRRSR